MSSVSLKMPLLASALIVMGTVGIVATAGAKTSSKIWDPAYGGALPDLGWSGKVDFDIKDDCLDNVVSSSMWVSNLTRGCNNALSISSATVTLYDIDSFGNNGSAPDVTLNYGGSAQPFGGDNAQVTWRMYIDVDGSEKTLKAVQGGFLFPEFTDASFAKVVGFEGAAYWLNFNANKTNNFGLFSDSEPVGGNNGDFAFLTSCSYRHNASPDEDQSYSTYSLAHKFDVDVKCSQNDGVNNPAVLRPVPEPETYLLGLASFGVLGIWARRRRLNAR